MDVEITAGAAPRRRQHATVQLDQFGAVEEGREHLAPLALDRLQGRGQFLCARKDVRRIALLGNRQQPQPAQREPRPGRQRSQRNGKQQADDDRRHPQEQWRGDDISRRRKRQPEQSVQAVAAETFPQRHARVVAALRAPAGIASEQDLQHGGGLHQHQDGSREPGYERLDQEVEEAAQRAAAAAPQRLFADQDQIAEQLGRQQQSDGTGEHLRGANRILHRPLREQREAWGKVFRSHEPGLQRDQHADP